MTQKLQEFWFLLGEINPQQCKISLSNTH